MMKQVIAIVIALVLGMGVSFAQQKSAQKKKVIKTERIQKAEKKGPYCTIPAKERTTKCTEAEQKCAKAEGKCDKAEQKCAKAEGKCDKAEQKCAKAEGKCDKAEGKCAKAEGKCDKAEGKCEKAQLNTPDCCQKEFKCCPKTECNKEDKSGCCNKDANAHCLKNKKAE